MFDIHTGDRVKFGNHNEMHGKVIAITDYPAKRQVLAIVLLDEECQGYMEGRKSFISTLVADIGGLVKEDV